MKRITILLAIAFYMNTSPNAQNSLAKRHPVIIAINTMNFSQYIGLPVDSLVAHLPAGYTELKIMPSFVLKRAAFLRVGYAPSTGIYIAVRAFNHMNPEFVDTGTPTQNWNIDLFKKEKISFVVAFNGDCINGCEHRYKLN